MTPFTEWLLNGGPMGDDNGLPLGQLSGAGQFACVQHMYDVY